MFRKNLIMIQVLTGLGITCPALAQNTFPAITCEQHLPMPIEQIEISEGSVLETEFQNVYPQYHQFWIHHEDAQVELYGRRNGYELLATYADPKEFENKRLEPFELINRVINTTNLNNNNYDTIFSSTISAPELDCSQDEKGRLSLLKSTIAPSKTNLVAAHKTLNLRQIRHDPRMSEPTKLALLKAIRQVRDTKDFILENQQYQTPWRAIFDIGASNDGSTMAFLDLADDADKGYMTLELAAFVVKNNQLYSLPVQKYILEHGPSQPSAILSSSGNQVFFIFHSAIKLYEYSEDEDRFVMVGHHINHDHKYGAEHVLKVLDDRTIVFWDGARQAFSVSFHEPSA